MKKVYVKEFESRKQMWNYFNKAKNNEQLAFVVGGYYLKDNKWKVEYQYK